MTASVTAAKVIEAFHSPTDGVRGPQRKLCQEALPAGQEAHGGVRTRSCKDRDVDRPSLGTRCGSRPDPDRLLVPGSYALPLEGE